MRAIQSETEDPLLSCAPRGGKRALYACPRCRRGSCPEPAAGEGDVGSLAHASGDHRRWGHVRRSLLPVPGRRGAGPHAPTCSPGHRVVNAQATVEEVIDAAEEGDLAALVRLLGEDPTLLNCKDRVRIPRKGHAPEGQPPRGQRRAPRCDSTMWFSRADVVSPVLSPSTVRRSSATLRCTMR